MLWTTSSILEKGRGSFEILPAEGVSCDIGRWMKIGRFRIDREGDEAAGVAVHGGDAMDNGETLPA